MDYQLRIVFTFIAVVFLIPALSSCASTSEAEGEAIFDDPKRYLGHEVIVCGYVHIRYEDTNMWPSKDDRKKYKDGLGVVPQSIQYGWEKFDGTELCVRGIVEDTRCGLEKVCTWTPYRYAIRILSIVSEEFSSNKSSLSSSSKE